MYYIHLHPTKPGKWIINSPSLRKHTSLLRNYKCWANALDAVDWVRSRMNVPPDKIKWVWGKELGKKLQAELLGKKSISR